MALTQTPTKTKIIIEPQEAYEIFRMSTALADRVEEILESHGAYRKEFLQGLTRSFKEAQEGKLVKVESLLELI